MLWLFNSLLVWLGIAKATTVLPKPNFKNGFQINGVDFDGDESGYLSGITPGTIAASKAVVVDSNKDASAFRNLSATTVSAGSSVLSNGIVQSGSNGNAGVVRIYPATALKGYLQISAADNTGNTVNTIEIASQTAARAITIPDWSTKASNDAEVSLAGIKVVADTTNRPGALGCLLFSTGDSKLYVCTTASATAATWTVVGTQS